jgi:hypothetical protein
MSSIWAKVTSSIDGSPCNGVLVELNGWNAEDGSKPGLFIAPNPRATGADGRVNFLIDPSNTPRTPTIYQATVLASGGMSGATAVATQPFTGKEDIELAVVADPFA